ncbi:MAG: peptidylprolyl isomerase [Bacteroidales bacterium]|nr:peptidylprolyl isomerase [Bacteroidales bacterium]
MKSKILTFTLIAALCVLTAACGQRKGKTDNTAVSAADSTNSSITDLTMTADYSNLPEDPIFEIYTSEGTITVQLYADTPRHRDNFVKLAKEKFYDGILFHRVIKGFMIQGGDPLTKDPANKSKFGTGGPGYTIPAEIRPNHTHIKGALATARLGDMANPRRESSGSQFYIVHDPDACAQLDGAYTVFGEVIDGIEVVDKIANVQTDMRDCPIKEVKIITITPVL